MSREDRFQHALVLGFEGDFEGSGSELRQLELDYPSDLDVKYELAMLSLMIGRFGEGCSKIREILSIDPNHEKARLQEPYCREDKMNGSDP